MIIIENFNSNIEYNSIEQFKNKVFFKDNLEFLKKLPNDSIDLVYSDILYGTGRTFKQYKDINANKKEIYDFYYPRCFELYRVLKGTGSLYLQMDWRISHWIREILDEFFGYENFKNEIFWPREQSKGAKSKSKQYARNSDIILFYAKSDKYIWNGCFKEYDQEYIDKRFRPDETGRMFMDSPLGSFANRIEELKKENRIYFTKTGNPRYKQYLDELNGIAIGDIWNDINPVNSQANENVGYDTQKPIELLDRIITSSSNEGDVVLDIFCGSGTTGVSAEKNKRFYICCDNSIQGIEKCRERNL